MPKVIDHERQREAIRGAARSVFARRGLAATGLGHVAAELGVGRSSLYHYYPDKDALVRDIAHDLLRDEEALFRAMAEDEGPALARILRLTEVLASLYGEWRSIGRLVLQLWASEPERFGKALRSMRRSLAKVIEDGIEDGSINADLDPEDAASVVIGLIDGLLIQYFLDVKAFPDPTALGVAAVVAVRKVLAA